MAIPRAHIILAYRILYRGALQAVRYSKPARYIARDILNDAFRNGPRTEFNAKKIGNTILFLQNAAKVKGLEHKILKNLMHVRWWQRSHRRRAELLNLAPLVLEHERHANQQYEVTLQMLNESMDLCLK